MIAVHALVVLARGCQAQHRTGATLQRVQLNAPIAAASRFDLVLSTAGLVVDAAAGGQLGERQLVGKKRREYLADADAGNQVALH